MWFIRFYYLGHVSMRRAETLYSWSVSSQSKSLLIFSVREIHTQLGITSLEKESNFLNFSFTAVHVMVQPTQNLVQINMVMYWYKLNQL